MLVRNRDNRQWKQLYLTSVLHSLQIFFLATWPLFTRIYLLLYNRVYKQIHLCFFFFGILQNLFRILFSLLKYLYQPSLTFFVVVELSKVIQWRVSIFPYKWGEVGVIRYVFVMSGEGKWMGIYWVLFLQSTLLNYKTVTFNGPYISKFNTHMRI